MSKKCTVCNIQKDYNEYYKNKQSKDGFRNNCKCCEKLRKREYFSKPDIIAAEKIKKKEYRLVEFNRIKAKNNTKKWYKNNLDKVKEYQKENRQNILANNAKYRASKMRAAFNQYDNEIKRIYNDCPEDYEVHHIVPLREFSEIVCGLHVPWNLQALTREEHLKAHEELRKMYA